MHQAVRDALIGFMAATAQAQAEASKAAQRAGIDHARAERQDAYRGRKPSFNRGQFEAGRVLIDGGATTMQVAAICGVSRGTVHRFRTDPAGCAAALGRWSM